MNFGKEALPLIRLVDQDVLDADFMVVGSDTEDNSDSEGLVRYDLLFDAIVPTTQKIIRLVINIEIQADTNLNYAIVARAVYYTARPISRQKGTVFNNSHYEKIQKVYSISICPDPKRKMSTLSRSMVSHSRK
jgi:hypothetical protein